MSEQSNSISCRSPNRTAFAALEDAATVIRLPARSQIAAPLAEIVMASPVCEELVPGTTAEVTVQLEPLPDTATVAAKLSVLLPVLLEKLNPLVAGARIASSEFTSHFGI